MASGDDRVVLGRIAGVHGIRGEVVVASFTDDPARLPDYAPLQLGDTGREIVFESFKPYRQGFLARIVGIADRTAAETVKGFDLVVPRDRLPALEDDEFYHADLIGLAAVDAAGTAAGTVHAVLNFGAGDILEIAIPGEKRTMLLPFNRDTVPEIDLDAGRLVIVPPEETEGEEAP